MDNAKILLVDDEPALTASLSKLLSAKGYAVNTVASGEEALSVLPTCTYDVVILDLKMPGIGGVEPLKRIKKLGHPAEVLILPGRGSIDTAMETIHLGAFDYLLKPCDLEDLLTKIEDALKKKTVRSPNPKRTA